MKTLRQGAKINSAANALRDERIRQLAAAGLSRVTIARRLGVSPQTVWRAISTQKEIA